MQTAVLIWNSIHDRITMHSIEVHAGGFVTTASGENLVRIVFDRRHESVFPALRQADIIFPNYEYIPYNDKDDKDEEIVIVDIQLKEEVQIAFFGSEIDLSRGLLPLPTTHFGSIRIEEVGDGTIRVVGMKELPEHYRAPF